MSRPIEDIEIWRAASQLIRRFPHDADMQAARRADMAYQNGDMFNFDLWTRINTAVLELQRMNPKDGEAVN